MSWIAPTIVGLYLTSACLGQPIAVLFEFKTPPEPAVVMEMKSEIRDILGPAHLDLTFERVGSVSSRQSFRKIILVRFQGACQSGLSSDPIQLEQPALLDLPALGKTEISDGRILPYVRIFCNEVRAFVPTVSNTPQERMYGRALGRVVVHELYHALLSTAEHAQKGIAGAVQSSRDLTREKLALDAVSIQRLRDMWGETEDSAPLPQPRR